MIKLDAVRLQDFKSVHQATIEHLDAINILFGPTNCGKTSILESVYFQFNHQRITSPVDYFEFLHSKADPRNAILSVSTEWHITEAIPTVNLRPNDRLRFVTTVNFSKEEPKVIDQTFINETLEENPDRTTAVVTHMHNSIKLSSSRRPGDSKKAYYPSSDETPDMRRQRFLNALRELELQGNQYREFLSHLQKLFPHLVYGADSKESIVDFFGMGFLGTAKLFLYLFDARYSLVLIDEPEIHFYPSLVRRFVQVLHEVVEDLGKQVIIGTHSTLFLHEKHLGNFYHLTKSKHFQTAIRQVEQDNLLQGLDLLNAPPEAVLQSDLIIYAEGPWDVGVLEEFIAKYPELDHVNITVLQLGGGSMGNQNVDPVKLKQHNPLSFVIMDSERAGPNKPPDPSHVDFLNRCYQAKLYCLMLDFRAMENYFTPRALQEVFGKSKVHAGVTVHPYKPLETQGLSWYTKDWDRRVARAMTREEVESFPDLRAFFHELIHVSQQVQ